MLIGLTAALAGHRRWRTNEEAIRTGAALPVNRLVPGFVSAIAAVSVGVAVLVGIEVMTR